MSIIDRISQIFTSDQRSNDYSKTWNQILSKEDIAGIFDSSKAKTQVVFKHSSSCGISFFAMRSLNTPELLENEHIDLHLIDVIHQRSTSQDFAEKVNIRHESPQIFVIKDGEITWHGSHNSVNAKNVLSNI